MFKKFFSKFKGGITNTKDLHACKCNKCGALIGLPEPLLQGEIVLCKECLSTNTDAYTITNFQKLEDKQVIPIFVR